MSRTVAGLGLAQVRAMSSEARSRAGAPNGAEVWGLGWYLLRRHLAPCLLPMGRLRLESSQPLLLLEPKPQPLLLPLRLLQLLLEPSQLLQPML